jgi:hypothetical protein
MKITNLSCRKLPMLAGIIIFLASITAPISAHTPRPTGPVVLTVAGKIGTTNRPAFDKLQDRFFNYHKREFTRAFEFDLQMMEALGTRKAVITHANWPQPVTVEGPLLREVLAAAGVETGRFRITALDGFAVELGPKDLADEDWIVALKADGRYLGIGERGPSWILYARRDGKPAVDEDEVRWPWAAFLIEIE